MIQAGTLPKIHFSTATIKDILKSEYDYTFSLGRDSSEDVSCCRRPPAVASRNSGRALPGQRLKHVRYFQAVQTKNRTKVFVIVGLPSTGTFLLP